MNSFIDKTQENKSQSVATEISQKKQNSNKPTFQIEDNRPEVIAQRKLQELANGKPKHIIQLAPKVAPQQTVVPRFLFHALHHEGLERIKTDGLQGSGGVVWLSSNSTNAVSGTADRLLRIQSNGLNPALFQQPQPNNPNVWTYTGIIPHTNISIAHRNNDKQPLTDNQRLRIGLSKQVVGQTPSSPGIIVTRPLGQ
ncbi:MAG: hypothetical protein R8N23_09185 [Reichenbachiella sp.]|uniref:hypothetical protein n=1 Tax=Reichenbachiella sp. TaxID=2184521 RepID=UPI002966A78E|nr:hypothetical protein [Reichenbachiella sp.]MDW3210029.1 hypothetical protein [Reichenbachiella sp.]